MVVLVVPICSYTFLYLFHWSYGIVYIWDVWYMDVLRLQNCMFCRLQNCISPPHPPTPHPSSDLTRKTLAPTLPEWGAFKGLVRIIMHVPCFIRYRGVLKTRIKQKLGFLKTRFFSPFSSDPVKLYVSVPVELYTVFSTPKHLAKTLVKNLANNLAKIWPKSAQTLVKILACLHVFKTSL